jgi:hypothetical protein
VNVLIIRIRTALPANGVRRGGAGSLGFPEKALADAVRRKRALRGGVKIAILKYDVHEVTAFQLCPSCAAQMPVRRLLLRGSVRLGIRCATAIGGCIANRILRWYSYKSLWRHEF